MATIRSNWKRRKSPEGKPLCLVCGIELTGRKQSYCCHDHYLANRPGDMRRAVYHRDKGVCALCGLDTGAQEPDPRQKYSWRSEHTWEADHIVPVSEGGGLCGLDGYRTLCRACHGIESGKLRKRLNEAKRLAKIQKENGTLF